MITLIIVAALALTAGYLIEHYASAAKIASIEAVLKGYEVAAEVRSASAVGISWNEAVAEVKTLIADVRAKL